MNKEIENFISKYSVRIKLDNTPNGSAVIIPMPSEEYDYIITAKHCLFSKNVLSDNISIDFWNINDGKFHEMPLNIDNTQILFNDDENLDLAIIIVKKTDSSQFLQNTTAIFICDSFPAHNQEFFFRGFPKGSNNKPYNLQCQYSSDEPDYLTLKSPELETNDTSASTNTEGFSGSGVWFQYQNKFYLTSIVTDFNKALPTFKTIKIHKMDDILEAYSEYKNIELTDFLSVNNTTPKIITQEEDPNDKFILHFTREYSNFIGRDKEFSILNNFLNSEKTFEWAYITGQGGVGKSRLLSEFIKKTNKSKEWKIDYTDHYESYQISDFTTNTLIVIDDESVEWREIEKLILTSLKCNSHYKIRIVFLSRILPKEFDESLETNPQLLLNFFNKNGKEMNLGGLSDIEYIELIRSIINKKENYIEIDDETLTRFKAKLDPLKRPIFAMLIGLSLSNNQDISNWITDDLLNYHYLTERSKCKDLIGDNSLLDKHLNLMAVLFILKRPHEIIIKEILELNKKWLPDIEELNNDVFQNFFSLITDTSHRVSIYPDIISSYFTLNRLSFLSQDSIKYGKKEVIDIIKWIHERSHRPIDSSKEIEGIMPSPFSENSLSMCLSEFNQLILQDFPEHELVIDIIEASDIYKQNYMDSYIPLSGLVINLMRNTTDELKLYSYEKILQNLKSDHHNVILNAINAKYILITNRLDIERCYNEIREASESFLNNPWNGDTYFMNFEKPDYNFYEEIALMEEYATKKEKENVIWAAIPHVEAMTIYFIISNKVIISNYTDLQLFDRIEFLSRTWTDPEIKYILIKILTTQNLHNQYEIITKLDMISKELLKTPKQVHPINVSLIIVNSFFLIMRYFYSQGLFQPIDHFYKMLLKYIAPIEKDKKNRIATVEFMRENKLFFDDLDISKQRPLCALLFAYSQELETLFHPDEDDIKPYKISF